MAALLRYYWRAQPIDLKSRIGLPLQCRLSLSTSRCTSSAPNTRRFGQIRISSRSRRRVSDDRASSSSSFVFVAYKNVNNSPSKMAIPDAVDDAVPEGIRKK